MATSILEKFDAAIPPTLYTGFSFTRDQMPEEPGDAICIYHDQSGPSLIYFGESDTIGQPMITLSVRSSTYAAGYDVAEAIRVFFQKFYSSEFLKVIPGSQIMGLGKDADGYRRFMVVFNVMMKE